MNRTSLQNSSLAWLTAVTVCIVALWGFPSAARAQLYQYGNSCTDCHAMPPLDDAYRNITTGGFKGSHTTHNLAAVAPQAVCQKCHSGAGSYTTSHMDGYINMTTNINNSAVPATYNKPRFFNRTSNPALTTCANVNCHFENTTPVWSTSPIASPGGCATCHGAPPADGNHPVAGQKHGTYYGTDTGACVKCHVDHTADANPFSHATSAGKRSIMLGFMAAPNSGGTYSKAGNLSYPNYLPSQNPVRNGSCTNLYCHSNGNGGSANQAPQWGGTLPADCSGCHGGNATAFTHITSGKHAKHTNNAAFLGTNFECARCHSATVSAGNDRVITTLSNHVNGTKNILFAQGGTYSGGNCSGTLCHAAGKASAPQPTPPSWTGATSLECKGCHGVGGNYGEPSYVNAGVAADLANSHSSKHVKGAFSCTNCHNNTTTDGVSLKAGGLHLNGSINVVFSSTYDRGGASYNGAVGTKSCSNIYCHSNGNGGNPNLTPQWGTTLPSDCTACHGNDATASVTILSGKHRAHLNNYTTFGRGNNFGCVQCHAKTLSDNRTIANAANHANTIKDYSGARSGRIATPGTGKCNNNYCHSTGQSPAAITYWNMTGANWYSGRTLSCTGCHGSSPSPEFAAYLGAPNYVNGGAGTSTANSHNQHVVGNGLTSTTGCATCHYRTVDSALVNKLRDYSTLHLNRTRDIAFSVAASQAGVQGRYSSTSQQCMNTYCHGVAPSVKWGSSSLACNACHSAEYTGFNGNNAGGHKLHYQVTTTPASGTYATMTPGQGSSATSSSYQFNCSSCHYSPAVHASGEAIPGSAAAQIYFGYSGLGRKGSYSYGTTQGTDNGFKWTNGSCATTYCHSNGNGGDPNNTTFTWASPQGTLGCTGCHGNNAGSGTPISSNKHGKHINNTALLGLGNNFSCVECHAKTVSDDTHISNKRNHVNRFKDFSGSRGGGSASYSNQSCSSTYCHTSGKKGVAGVTEPTAPVWTSATTFSCDGCHGISTGVGYPNYASGAVSSAAANSHGKHVSALTITDTKGCSRCHAKTVDAGVVNKLRDYSTLHLNRSIDISFAAGGNYNGAIGNKTCSSIYCHSSGQSSVAPFTPMSTPHWGGSLTCRGCHRADAASGTPMSSGSHNKHVGGAPYTLKCVKCHAATATASMTIANPANHVNGMVNIKFDSTTTAANGEYGWMPTPYSKPAGSPGFTKECNNVYCHSSVQSGADGTGAPDYSGTLVGDSTPSWGNSSSVKCGMCHYAGLGSHAEVDPVTLAPTGFVIDTGSHSRHLDYTFNTSEPTMICIVCHNTGGATFVPGVSDCSSCHSVLGTKHVNQRIDVSIPTYFGASASYNGSPVPQAGFGTCTNIYCHSDGQASPTYAPPVTWGSTPRTCTSCHGSATSPGAGGSSLSGKHPSHVNNDAVLGTGNSLHCIECHRATVFNDSTILSTLSHVNKMVDYTGAKAGGPTRYNSTTKSCSNFYCHSNGNRKALVFRSMTGSKVWTGNASLGCNGCHGNDAAGTFPTSATGAPNYPSAGPGTSTANSHQKHVYDAGITDTTGCAKCHYRTVNALLPNKLRNYSTMHLNGTPTISFSAAASMSGVQGRYSSTSQQCLNTYCHGANPSVRWGSSSLACNACHSAEYTGFNANNAGGHKFHYQVTSTPASGSYATMTPGQGSAASAGSYQFNCTSCHSSPATHAGGEAIAGTAAAQIYFGYSSGGRKGSYSYGTLQGTDNGFKWTGGSCTTTYCHSNGRGGDPANTSFTWVSTQGTLGCTGCHDNKQTGVTATTLSGKHDKHMNPTHNTIMGAGNGLNCVNCHAKTVGDNSTVADKTKHVNRFVDFSSNRGGGSSHYDGSTKLCSNIYCHSNGNSAAPVYQNPAAWTSGTSYGCNGCHGTTSPLGAPDYANGGTGTGTANSHAKHLSALNITSTTGCAACHQKTVSATLTERFKDYTAGSYHVNGVRNVNFAGGGSFNPAGGYCSNVSCHSNGRGAYATPQWGGTTNCGLCHPLNVLSRGHSFHIYTSASNLPTAYQNLTTNRSGLTAGSQRYNFGCANCHPLTNPAHTTGTVVLDFRRNVTGVGRMRFLNASTITASGIVGTANSGTTGTPGSSVKCQNVYCHSNGYSTNPVYAQTPDWYSGNFTGDRCANCHGNSPNTTIAGSKAHYNNRFLGYSGVTGGHQIGIHAFRVYSSFQGLAQPGTGGDSTHGNEAVESLITCYLCHNATVTTHYNDNNYVCSTCHYPGNPRGAHSGMPASIADKTRHVNGTVDVVFRNMTINSKAQMRTSRLTQSPYSTVWRRVVGYKVPGAHDTSKYPLNTGTMWDGSTKTCSSIACHNGQTIKWSDTDGTTTCLSCHTAL